MAVPGLLDGGVIVDRSCRVCGCTDDDCGGCIERTGFPCYWAEEDLCSACAFADHPGGPPAPGEGGEFVL